MELSNIRFEEFFLRRFSGLGPSHMSHTSLRVLIYGSLIYVHISHAHAKFVRSFCSEKISNKNII